MALITVPAPSAAGLRATPMTELVSRADPRTVVVLRGDVDLSNRPILCDMLCQQIARQVGDVVIDLGEVTHIDTAAVCVLAMGYEILDRQGRKLTFRSASRQSVEVLHHFGLTGLIETATATRRAQPCRLSVYRDQVEGRDEL